MAQPLHRSQVSGQSHQHQYKYDQSRQVVIRVFTVPHPRSLSYVTVIKRSGDVSHASAVVERVPSNFKSCASRDINSLTLTRCHRETKIVPWIHPALKLELEAQSLASII